jgi:hypothetical protein
MSQSSLGFTQGVFMNLNETHRRAEALFKKEQQLREAQQAMADYQAELHAMRDKTARLRTLRFARDLANQRALPADQKGAAQLTRQRARPKKIRTRLGRTEHNNTASV